MRRRWLRLMMRCGAAGMLCCALLCVGGCNIFGAVASKAVGPTKVQAQYTPPPAEPLLVLAENYRNPSDTLIDAEQLVRYVSRQLEEKKVAPIVDPNRVFELRSSRPAKYRDMSIADIAREAGAKQVIYIDVVQSGIVMADASEMMKAMISTRVRVVDAQSAATLWPPNAAEGLPIVHETPLVRVKGNVTEDRLRQQAARGVAERIARLFYTYTPEFETRE